jgi:HSP20 family protein
MMTMYMTPYRRRVHQFFPEDRVARNIDSIQSEVHVPLDVKEEKDSFVIYAVVPGLNPDDVNIEIVNNTLNISGEFVNEMDENETYLRNERPSGSFRRSLRFPTKLEASKAEAKLENGILTLRVPKVAEAQPKSIKVKAG